MSNRFRHIIQFIGIFMSLGLTLHANPIDDESYPTVHEGSNIRSVNIIKGATKAKADSAYKNEDYKLAACLYESVIDQDGESAALYYNLGNCYYKMENVALSILNYERALLLDPGDGDIRTNLALARGRTTDKVTPPSEMFFITWARSLSNIMSIDRWAKTGVCSFILMLLCLSIYFFSSKTILRKIGFYVSIAMLALTIVANLCALWQHHTLKHRDTAIVLTPSISVKSSPNQSSTDLFVIHEGTKVSIEDASMKGWKEIKLEEGKVGWIPSDAIEII